jgi:DNA-directed RNA polymerase specialized sigma24 family protein
MSPAEPAVRVPDDRRDALEALYRAFFARLVRHAAWSFHLSKEDATEVVQEAFLLALVKLDASGNPISWIYRVVENIAANWKRKADRRARLLAERYPAAARQSEGEGSR